MSSENEKRETETIQPIARAKPLGEARAAGHYEVKCIGPDGKEKWTDGFDNIVVNQGLDYLLSVGLANGTQKAIWYMGLLASGTPLATWVYTNVASVDFIAYAETPLPTWSPGAVSGQSVANGTAIDYTINGAGGTVVGAFLIASNDKTVATDEILYSAGLFTGGSKSVSSGDTLQVTATFTQADA